jgi:uncharacterized protein
MYARPFIDSIDFAKNGREISGEAPLAEMTRLLDMLDMLESPQGVLSYTVRGGMNSFGVLLLNVSMAGHVQLCCQRCLNVMDYPISLEERLLLRDQVSLDALGDDEEEFDSILAEAHLDVLNILEEEILLSLPIAPRHESGDCMAAANGNRQGEAKNPFAALAELKVVK